MITRWYTNAKDSEVFSGPDGPFVLFTDYAKLEAELAECKKVRDSWCAEYTKLRDAK
jgi:hypothetical protein